MRAGSVRMFVAACTLSCAHVMTANAQASSATASAVPVACRTNAIDSLDANFVPAGYGTLKMDDISFKITLTGGLQVTASPMDEKIIRLLAPDAYKNQCTIRASRQKQIDSIANRDRLPKYSLWYVQFYTVEQGETRFSPQEFVFRNVGRDLRPRGVIPLSSGFGDYRLHQRETQFALYVFDGQLDVNQPLVAVIQGVQSNTDWAAQTRRIEQERALVRSRAASRP